MRTVRRCCAGCVARHAAGHDAARRRDGEPLHELPVVHRFVERAHPGAAGRADRAAAPPDRTWSVRVVLDDGHGAEAALTTVIRAARRSVSSHRAPRPWVDR